MHRNVARGVAVVTLLASGLLVGCGGSKNQPAVEPGLTTVGTLSKQSAAQPVVQDMNAIRAAMNSGQEAVAFNGIYDLINRAVADKDVKHAAATVRRELPGLVATLTRSYPAVRDRVRALKLKTQTGVRFRRFALAILHDDLVLSQSLNANVAHSQYVFTAVERWGKKNNTNLARDNARLNALVARASPTERAALKRAVREVFHIQVK